MMFQEADSNQRIDEGCTDRVSLVLKRVWKEEELDLYYTGQRLYLATVDGDLTKLHIVFDDQKSIKIGHLLRDSEIDNLREIWPEGLKVWEIRPPYELSTDKLTRGEGRKMIDRSEKRTQKKVDEYFEKFLKSQRDFMTSQMKVTELLIKATAEAFGKKLDEIYNKRVIGNRSTLPANKNSDPEMSDVQEKSKYKDLASFKDSDNQINAEDLEEKILNTLIRSEMVEDFLRTKGTNYRDEYEDYNPYKEGATRNEKVIEGEDMHRQTESKDWKQFYGKRETEDNFHENANISKSKTDTWRGNAPSWDRSAASARVYRNRGKKSLEKTRCFSCGKNGHLSATCPTPGLIHCYRCNKTGTHLARDCTEYKNKDRREDYREPDEKRKSYDDDSYREKSREKFPSSTIRDDKGDWKRSKSSAYWSDSEGTHRGGGDDSDGY